MKKILTSVLVLVAIASFGTIFPAVHADTSITPAQAATLAAILERHAGTVASICRPRPQRSRRLPPRRWHRQRLQPCNPRRSPPRMPRHCNSGLSLLAAALTNLKATLAANPQLVAGHEAAVLATLQGIGTTLAAIGTSAGNGQVAMASPAPANNVPATVTPAPAPSAAQAAPAPLLSALGPNQGPHRHNAADNGTDRRATDACSRSERRSGNRAGRIVLVAQKPELAACDRHCPCGHRRSALALLARRR